MITYLTCALLLALAPTIAYEEYTDDQYCSNETYHNESNMVAKFQLFADDDYLYPWGGTDYSYYLFSYGNDYMNSLLVIDIDTPVDNLHDVTTITSYPIYETSLRNSPIGLVPFGDGLMASTCYYTITFQVSDFEYNYTSYFYSQVGDLPTQEDRERGNTKFTFSIRDAVHVAPSASTSLRVFVTIFTTNVNGNAYQEGYNAGYEQGTSHCTPIDTDLNFGNYIFAIFDSPLYIIRGLFDFDVYGINILAALLSLLSLVIVIFIIRKFIS